MPKLTTDRLVLRPIAESDLDALQAFWNDPEVRRFLWADQIMSRETVSELISASQACFAKLGTGFFAIEVDARPGTLVGFCGHRLFEDGTHVELRYGMLPEYWGEGFVTEAAQEVLRYGFEECGIDSVIGATETPNQRAVRTMQRLGMVFDERREFHGLDTVFYKLHKHDFAIA